MKCIKYYLDVKKVYHCHPNVCWLFCSTELPEDVIKVAKDIKPITEIKQNGNDFVVTSKTPGKSVTNTFTIGKEADITTMDGKKLKVCLSHVAQQETQQQPTQGLTYICFHESIQFNRVFKAEVVFCEILCLNNKPARDVSHISTVSSSDPSALSIRRVDSWCAKLASSSTPRRSREGSWLRYMLPSCCVQCTLWILFEIIQFSYF